MTRVADPYEGKEASRAIIGRDVRLVFTWVDDRWAQYIVAGSGESPGRILVASRDDEAELVDPAGPVRPVYQQLHFQAAGDGHQALLVGQSGHDHFAASIHFAEHDDGGTRIEFDIAGRHTHDPAATIPLAPTYVVDMPLTDVEEASHRLVRWAAIESPGHLMIGTVEREANSTIVLVSEAGRRGSLVQVYARGEPVDGARRCRYRWTWEAPRGVGA